MRTPDLICRLTHRITVRISTAYTTRLSIRAIRRGPPPSASISTEGGRAESCKSYRLSSLNLTLTFRGTGEPVGRNGARNDGRPPLPTQITYALPRLSQESNDSAPIFYRLSADHLPDSSTPRFASNVASSRRGTIRVRRDSNFSNALSFAIPDLAEVNIKQGLYTCHLVYEGGKLGSKINSS